MNIILAKKIKMSVSKVREIPEILKLLLEELEFIAQFQEGKKVNLSGRSFNRTGTYWEYWDNFKRTLVRESRRDLVKYLQRIQEESITALSDYEQTNEELLYMLVDSMHNAIPGIENAAKTYRSDPWTVAQIRVILKDITNKLAKFNK